MNYTKSAAVVGLLILAACSGNDVKTTLGLDRGTPDEFRVVSRPPLSVPPDFTLPSPSDTGGNMSVNQPSASTQAQKILTSSAPVTDKNPVNASQPENTAEAAFLKDAGANQANPKIRQEITEERMAGQEQQQDDSGWWNLWSTGNPPKKDPVVDAAKEQQRIQTDEDTGQPVTTGNTPTVKQKDTGLLGQLFGY